MPDTIRPSEHATADRYRDIVLTEAAKGLTPDAALAAAIRRITGPGRLPTRAEQRHLAKVIEALNRDGKTDLPLPAPYEPLPRPSVLPVDPDEWVGLQAIRQLRDYLWDEWFATRRAQSDYELGFAIELALSVGLGTPNVHPALRALRWRDLVPPGDIEIRIAPRDDSDRRCRLRLSDRCRILLARLRQFRPTVSPEAFIFLPGKTKPKERAMRLRRRLERGYRALLRDFRSHHDTAPPSLSELLRTGPLLCLFDGLEEPFLLSVLRRSVLPSDLPAGDAPYLCGLAPGIDANELPEHGLYIPTDDEHFRLPADTRIAATLEHHIRATDNPKADLAYDILQKLCEDLLRMEKRRLSPSKADQARELFTKARHAADALGMSRSVARLGIDWIEHKLVNRREIHPGTAAKYLRALFLNGFFIYADSVDLESWDPADFDDLREALLAPPGKKLSPRTRAWLRAVLAQLFNFAARHGYPCPSATGSLPEWAGGSGRVAMLGLKEIDAFTDAYYGSRRRDHATLATCTLLGFYAGLRPAEVLALTLNDVITDRGELYIQVPHTKTRASRRIVPLHLLAPPETMGHILAYVHRRRGEFRDDARIKTIALFGPAGVRDGYSRDALITTLIAHLKHHFGEEVIYYTLRHSFASWLLVRYYAASHREVLSLLREHDHVVFSSDAQRRLVKLLTLSAHDEIPDTETGCLLRIAKITGHASTETLWEHYVHTFHILHAAAIERVNRCTGSKVLSGATIGQLIWKLKSRTSQAKLKDRTISGLAEYVRRPIK